MCHRIITIRNAGFPCVSCVSCVAPRGSGEISLCYCALCEPSGAQARRRNTTQRMREPNRAQQSPPSLQLKSAQIARRPAPIPAPVGRRIVTSVCCQCKAHRRDCVNMVLPSHPSRPEGQFINIPPPLPVTATVTVAPPSSLRSHPVSLCVALFLRNRRVATSPRL